MRAILSFAVVPLFASLATFTFPVPSGAASEVTLDVPPLATAGSARSFEFVDFEFRVYLVPIGDPVSDYSANVLANDYENYTYEHAGGGGSGRGGGYRPPHYVRGPAATYSDTYTNVTRPPTLLDALFHFSGADVVGIPFDVAVQDTGAYSLTLTADNDPTHTPITPGTPLGNALYTLEYQTNSLDGSQVTLTPRLLPGDFNRDGIVDLRDYVALRVGMGTTYTQADYDTWRANLGLSYNTAIGLSAPVPEPATAILLTIALPAMWSRRRR